MQRILGLSIGDLLLEDTLEVINKGAIAEQHVALELVKSHSPYQQPQLYYWHRDAKNSQAEIDFLIQKHSDIIPVEVKAGSRGSMQSMYIFIKEKQSRYGIRFSLENFSSLPSIMVFPLYAVKNSMHFQVPQPWYALFSLTTKNPQRNCWS